MKKKKKKSFNNNPAVSSWQASSTVGIEAVVLWLGPQYDVYKRLKKSHFFFLTEKMKLHNFIL